MNIQTQKLQLIEWLVSLKDQTMVEELVKWKEDHQPISIEKYNQELDEANARIDSGEYITHEDVVKESSSWFKK